MQAPPAPRRVKCTYASCKLWFRDEKEMIKHKVNEPAHEYCKRCRMDFEDDEDLLVHKILSTNHIACQYCGLDFKSVGGMDSHVRQVSFPGTFSVLHFFQPALREPTDSSVPAYSYTVMTKRSAAPVATLCSTVPLPS